MAKTAIERILNPDQGTLDLILAFEAVLPQLQRVLDFEGATLFVAEEQGLCAVSGYRLPYFQHIRGTHVPWRNPLVQELLLRREALVLADVDADPRFVKNDSQVTLRSWIGVPIFLEDRLAGLLSINHSTPDHFDEKDGALALLFAQQVAALVEKDRLLQAERRRREEAEALRAATTALTLDAPLEQILYTLLERLRAIVPYDSACIMLQQGPHLRALAAVGLPRPEEVIGHTFPAEDVLFQRIRNQQAAVYYPDVKGMPEFQGWGGTSYVRGWMGVPLIHRGEVIGHITLDSRRPNAYGSKEAAQAQAFANQVAATIANAQLFQTLEQRVQERTQALALANQRLQELDRLKSDFIANVSHELRTPLTNILFYVNLLQDGRSERRNQYLHILEQEVGLLRRLIEDLLDISVLDASADAKTEVFTVFDLCVLVKQVVSTYHAQADNAQVTLEYTCRTGPLHMWGDVQRIEQLVTNLVVNAISYTPNGGRVHVQIAEEEQDGLKGANLTVSDTGMGIPEEEQAHIFHRFYRGRNVLEGETRGTGLGLALVKTIAEMHQGRVAVVSAPGEGSTFSVWLPLTPPEHGS